MQHLRQAAEMRQASPQYVLCHGDINPSNMFLVDGRLILVDWADALISEPFFDVAIASVLNALDTEQESQLFSAYLQREPTQEDWDLFMFMRQAVHMGFALNILGCLIEQKYAFPLEPMQATTPLSTLLKTGQILFEGNHRDPDLAEIYQLALASLEEVTNGAVAERQSPDHGTGHIELRPLNAQDPAIIEDSFLRQGWCKPASQYVRYLQEQQEGTRDVLIATSNGTFAGYVTVLYSSQYAPFREQRIPEISDLNVLQSYQGMGIGQALIARAEDLIRIHSPVAGLGVGLLQDYGPAQRLYIKLGYTPDGRGATYRGHPLGYGAEIAADDDLILWMTKRLR